MENLAVHLAHIELGSGAIQFGLVVVSLLIVTIVAARYIGAKMSTDFQEVSRKLEIARSRANSGLDDPAKALTQTARLMRRAADPQIADEREATQSQNVA